MRYPGIQKKYSGLPRIYEKEMNTDLGGGSFIFVCAQNDLFADAIPADVIKRVLDHCNNYPENKYLIQTKNPSRYLSYQRYLPKNFILGTTIESNRTYPEMGDTLSPFDRADCLGSVALMGNKRFVTIEPVLDFDVVQFADLLNRCNPRWINIGADSGNNNLPEPPKEKIDELIKLLNGKITIKKNMKRIK